MLSRILVRWTLLGLGVLVPAYMFIHVTPHINGSVINAESKKPVANAALLIGWKEFSLEGAGAVTRNVQEASADSNGNFSIPLQIYFGLLPNGFRDMEIGVAATGYVADTLLTLPADPYVYQESRWWGSRTVRLQIESIEFNRTSLANNVATNRPPLPAPQYGSTGEYHSFSRADGIWPIRQPATAFRLFECNNDVKYQNFCNQISTRPNRSYSPAGERR